MAVAARRGRGPPDAARGRAPAAPRAQPELPGRHRCPRGDPRRGRGRPPGRAVLEIGPGLGILTGGLLDAGAAVTAVELDQRARGAAAEPVRRSRSRAADAEPGAAGSLTLIEGDALDQPLTRLCPAPYDVVANLPYHITSPILHRLLGEPPRPDRLVLMVQREVAERIAAPPGKMSYLSVFVQYHATARIALRVPPTAFEPAPEVDSAVLVLEPFRPTTGSTRGDRGRALAARPGGVPRAAEDAPQRPRPAAAAVLRARSRRRSRRPDIDPTGDPRRSRSASGCGCSRSIGPVGPDLRGR